MIEIYNSVCAWNAARYDQVHNKELAMSLLREEYQEFLDAETEVDQLDGLCDTVYVAMGVLWKLNTPESVHIHCTTDAANIIGNFVDLNETDPAYFISTFLDVYEHATYPAAQAMYNIIMAASTQISGMGLDPTAALQIVCDANNSKAVKKTDSSVKANIDKGAGFIAPEPRLQALLDARNA